MGRLTLNVLLSFAQFEREVIGERIRDKIAASKKKGMWMGGVPPLGYGVRDHKLVMIDGEADTVRLMFRRYAELGSVRLLQAELEARGIRSKAWTNVSGRLIGDNPFSPGASYLMLHNRLYACVDSCWIAASFTLLLPERVWMLKSSTVVSLLQQTCARSVAAC